MKIVFMGTPTFAAASLKKLIDEGHEIALVVTQPDRKGNRNKLILSEVKQLALEHGLEVAQPERIKGDEEFIAMLSGIEPDAIVVAAFGQLLPKEVLNIPKYGCINVHGSLLPHLRGASPMQAAILEGLDETGVTIMRMDEGLDTGDMISKVKVGIAGMDITEVAERLANAGAELLASTLKDVESGAASYEPQGEGEATYSHLIRKTDGFTDFNEPAVMIERKIRAYADWPSCYTYLDGLQLKMYKAEVIEGEDKSLEPGTITNTDNTSYTINCLEGQIRILEQQLQGKKRMSAADFMRGRSLPEGKRLCAKED